MRCRLRTPDSLRDACGSALTGQPDGSGRGASTLNSSETRMHCEMLSGVANSSWRNSTLPEHMHGLLIPVELKFVPHLCIPSTWGRLDHSRSGPPASRPRCPTANMTRRLSPDMFIFASSPLDSQAGSPPLAFRTWARANTMQNYSDVSRLSGVPFTTSCGPFCRQT